MARLAQEPEMQLKVSTRILCNPSRVGASSLLATLSSENRTTDPSKIIPWSAGLLLQYELMSSDGDKGELLVAQSQSGNPPELLRAKANFYFSRAQSRPVRSLQAIAPDLLSVLSRLKQKPNYFLYKSKTALLLSPDLKDQTWKLYDAYTDDVVDTIPADPEFLFQPVASEDFWYVSFQVYNAVSNQWDLTIIEAATNNPISVPRQNKKSHVIAHSWLKDGRLIWSELSEKGHQIFSAGFLELRGNIKPELLAEFSQPRPFTIYEVDQKAFLIYPLDLESLQIKSLGEESFTSTLQIPKSPHLTDTKPQLLREIQSAPWTEEIFFAFDGRSHFLSYSMKNSTWKLMGPSSATGPCYQMKIGPEYRLEKQ
jgi:hypothetical protein